MVFRAEPEHNYPPEVARLGNEADRETREVIVDVRVRQLPRNWAVGQRAEVFIETDRKANVVTILQSFLLWQDGKPGVFGNEHDRAHWRAITLGLYGQKNVEVTTGLSAGDQLVKPSAGPKQPLEDGQAVAVK